jgi:hypothetical protein
MVLEKINKTTLENALKKQIEFCSINNYLNYINYLNRFLLEIVINFIIDSFESIDIAYENSNRRKELYYTDGFFHVDELFSLPKRDYYNARIKAYIIELSGKYSYIQFGEIIGDKIGTKFKSVAENKLTNISRQTEYNVIKSVDMDYLNDDKPNASVDTIYIRFDEKYVYTQEANNL